MKLNKRRYNFTMLAMWISFVFAILLISTLLASTIAFMLISFGLQPLRGAHVTIFWFTVLVILSVPIGTVIAAIVGNQALRPIRRLSDATTEISSGNFDIRIPVGRGPREIRILSESFNEMAKELSSIETLRNDFVSNVSHEFKTPIASIRGFAKILKRDNIPAEKRAEYIDIIINESDRLSQLANNILLLSKLEKKEFNNKRKPFLIDEQLRRSVLVLEPEWVKKGIVINIDLEPTECLGNEELLQQVWLNIIGNAIKYTPPDGAITISIHNFSDKISVEVSDTGEGMDEDTLKHMFDRFYQGDKSRQSEGNGLGLALVKRIVELHEAEIRYSSQKGDGTTFFIDLPKHEL